MGGDRVLRLILFDTKVNVSFLVLTAVAVSVILHQMYTKHFLKAEAAAAANYALAEGAANDAQPSVPAASVPHLRTAEAPDARKVLVQPGTHQECYLDMLGLGPTVAKT